jgi:antitoxin component YwqK of YwqJK toxin-antitoxin module
LLTFFAILAKNESRTDVKNPKYAKFRADRVKVICIFSKLNPNIKINAIENTSYKKRNLTYIVGRYIGVSNYDNNLNNVCAPGIHYYKSVEAAFYHEITYNTIYTGKYCVWLDDGSKYAEYNFVDGKQHGIYTEWYENGHYVEWSEDGTVRTKGAY